MSDLSYRPCVGAVLFNDEGGVFIGRRIGLPRRFDDAGMWQMPQGGIDAGETAEQAVLRELAEETGVRRVEVLGETPGWLTYDLPEELMGKVWGGRYRGQKQKWFALRHLGDEREINLMVPGHKPEFDLWRWEELERVPELVVPFKRHVYEEVARTFAPLARELRVRHGRI